jgi:hypothetical protein
MNVQVKLMKKEDRALVKMLELNTDVATANEEL